MTASRSYDKDVLSFSGSTHPAAEPPPARERPGRRTLGNVGPSLLLALVATVLAFLAISPAAEANPPAGTWQGMLNEEFTGAGLNTNLWTSGYPTDISKQCAAANLASQPGDGYLHLMLRTQASTCGSGVNTYKRAVSGGAVHSDPKGEGTGFTYSYGYVEWRAYVPGAAKEGVKCATGGCIENWPAFWSRPEGGPTEIDVMEGLDNGEPCYHFQRWYPGEHEIRGNCVTNVGGGWHTFGADLEPGQPLRYYYDGTMVGEVPWSDIAETKYMANQALVASYMEPQGNWGPFIVPAEDLVDYVRVWERPTPTVATSEATEIGLKTAKLNGSVYTNGLPTKYHFEYGSTTAYGSVAPVPDTEIGSGPGYNYAWYNLSGLDPGTTYHYRIVGTNSTGTSYGADKTFTTPQTAYVFSSDATNGNRLMAGYLDPSGTWQTVSFGGDSVATGSSPSAVRFGGLPYSFFVDATKANTISYRAWNRTTGVWDEINLGGHQVAKGTSPSAVTVNGNLYVFFVDATDNNSITVWSWTPGASWVQIPFWGDPVMANSSPDAISHGGAVQVYFADASKSNTITLWGWTPSAINQLPLGGDPVMAGSSPSAIDINGDVQIYFADAAKSNTITVWGWNSSGINQIPLGGDPVMAASSPSAINANGTSLVFFADAAKSNHLTYWSWGAGGLGQTSIATDPIAAGSSPSAVRVSGENQVYFSDASKANTMSAWRWGSTLQQNTFGGRALTTGSSPSATG